jgi:uncharacterized membrane protein YuzA (DUF378 family)
MENKENFNFIYSAQQQKEVEAIRKKYLTTEEDKMQRLRKLHAIPTQKAQTASLVVGVIGALIMGTGMSFIMTDLGQIFGGYSDLSMIIGIVVGLVGMVPVALAYPIYDRVLKKQREKIAPEILRLTDELLK